MDQGSHHERWLRSEHPDLASLAVTLHRNSLAYQLCDVPIPWAQLAAAVHDLEARLEQQRRQDGRAHVKHRSGREEEEGGPVIERVMRQHLDHPSRVADCKARRAGGPGGLDQLVRLGASDMHRMIERVMQLQGAAAVPWSRRLSAGRRRRGQTAASQTPCSK